AHWSKCRNPPVSPWDFGDSPDRDASSAFAGSALLGGAGFGEFSDRVSSSPIRLPKAAPSIGAITSAQPNNFISSARRLSAGAKSHALVAVCCIGWLLAVPPPNQSINVG